MRWCKFCVLPDTRPNIVIQSDGICNACHSHQQVKQKIDWVSREGAFQKVVQLAKSHNTPYDCLIPVSGGKDSTWQTIKCLEYGLHPLAVTWKTPARTSIGQKNLSNLISLGVDHIDYQINPKVEARFMLKTFKTFGSTAIPMHLALFNMPLAIAARFNIPLVIWGENSAFEYGAIDELHTGFKLDEAWLRHYGVTNGTTAEDWLDDELTRKDLAAYFGPSAIELDKASVSAIFLGYYFEWDPIRTTSIAEKHGFRSLDGQARTGFYNSADIDDDFISIHHWLKWFKFGFTRTFDNLSLEIRNGRITRNEALSIISKKGVETPISDIHQFCKFANIDLAYFMEIAESFRNENIWERNSSGSWCIPEFLISNWNWS